LEEGGAWREFTVVAEDGRNPVMEPLAALCRAHGGVHLRVGRPLAEDLELLLRARALVVGKGTFAMAVAALSEHLDGVHSFEHGFSPWGNGRVRVTEWGDERGDYRRAVLAGNWRNTAAQRELMLHYPMAAIRATGEHPAPEQPQPSPDCLSAYRMVHPCSRP
jgi:hypothetical protein